MPIRKGIDGIYINTLFDGKPPPPKYIINEVKFNTTNRKRFPNQWKNTLNNTKAGRQIGDDWVEIKLYEDFSWDLAMDIKYNHQRMITGISDLGAGQVVYSQNNLKEINHTIGTSIYNSGVYFVNLTSTTGQTVTKRLIIKK